MATSKRSSKDQRANLHASEEKYRTIVENAREGILVMQGGERVYYNPRWLEITGYSAEEYKNVKFLSLVHAEDVDVVTSAYETLISGEEFELDLEFRLVTSSGEIKYLKGKASRIEWEGKAAGMILANDITERIGKEKQLRRSETRFKALFEQVGDYCMILDPHTEDGIPIIVDANEAACKIHGYTREEFIGRPVADVDDEDGKQLVVGRTQMIMTGQPFYVENTHVRKDGTTFPVSVHANRIDIKGEPPLIFTTEYDITERKEAEISLRNSEEKHRRYVENAPVGVFVVDSTGKYINVNSVACELLGYTQSELLELSIPDVSIRKEAGDTFQNLKESGKLSYEGLLKKKDGSIVQVRLDAVSLPNNQFIAFCTDITERKRGEEELEKYRNHLEELVEERTEELQAKMEEHVTLFDMMIGREVRMAELKKVIKRLREQLKDNEIIPIANDPLLGDDAD